MDVTADEELQAKVSQTHSLQPVNHWATKCGISLPLAGLTGPCCDLCILKKAADNPENLTPVEPKILALRERAISSRKCSAHSRKQKSSSQRDTPTDVEAQPLHVRHGTDTGTRRGERRQCSRNGRTHCRGEGRSSSTGEDQTVGSIEEELFDQGDRMRKSTTRGSGTMKTDEKKTREGARISVMDPKLISSLYTCATYSK
jgi:hypothetical protein